MYAKEILFIVLLLISSFQLSNSRGGRGGGSRGGGSRVSSRSGSGSRFGGSSRSGSRSGSSGMIGGSTRYSSWSSRHGLSPTFRYRTSTYHYKRTGISTGLIIISPHYRQSFHVSRESSYNDISICYNEFSLYDRNLSDSPWFVCPWSDYTSRYCCGNEIEERCCRYFDRPGHSAGLIIGCIILVVIIAVTCHYCCKRSKRKQKSSLTMIYVDPEKINDDKHEECPLAPYPIYPIDNPPGDVCPPYNPTIPNAEGYPPYPLFNQPGEPFPAPTAPANPNLPYPVNPTGPMLQSDYPPQTHPMGYDQTGPTYPLIPPENPPPAYSDIVRQ